MPTPVQPVVFMAPTAPIVLNVMDNGLTLNMTTGGSAGAVTSVFGRTGAVAATAADYMAYYLSLTGGTVNGNVAINGNSTALSVSTSAAASFIDVVNFLAPNTAPGDQVQFLLGRDQSQYNVAGFAFNYVGANSPNNSFNFFLYQSALLLKITAAGVVTTVNNTLDDSTGKATFAGNITAPNIMTLVASTPAAGMALINGSQNFISWTAPNDGKVHRITVIGFLNITSTETGGGVDVSYTLPTGAAKVYGASSPNDGTGISGFGDGPSGQSITFMVQANTTVTVLQHSALTAGAATCFADIWAL